MEKCKTCGNEILPNCDWHQGRCPHRTPLMNDIILDDYKARFYNLLNWFRGK